MDRLRPYFPKSRGRVRVNIRLILSGIIILNRNGLRWCDAPSKYDSPKTLYNRWKRCSDMGVFGRIMMGLAEQAPDVTTISIDATYLKAHRTTSSLGLKKAPARLIGRTKGGMNTKLHAVTETIGWQIRFFMTAGEVSDFTGARALASKLQAAGWLLGNRGYDADQFCTALRPVGIQDSHWVRFLVQNSKIEV